MTKPLIVADKILVKLGVVQPCIDSLAAAGLDSAVFDDVVPNPHSELVEAGHARYVDAGCDAIIAFGGGSPMECAKVIGAKPGGLSLRRASRLKDARIRAHASFRSASPRFGGSKTRWYARKPRFHSAASA